MRWAPMRIKRIITGASPAMSPGRSIASGASVSAGSVAAPETHGRSDAENGNHSACAQAMNPSNTRASLVVESLKSRGPRADAGVAGSRVGEVMRRKL